MAAAHLSWNRIGTCTHMADSRLPFFPGWKVQVPRTVFIARSSSIRCPLDLWTRHFPTRPRVSTSTLSVTVPSRPRRRALRGYLGRGRWMGLGRRIRRLSACGPALADLRAADFRDPVVVGRRPFARARLGTRPFADLLAFCLRDVGLAAIRLGVFLGFPALGAVARAFLGARFRSGTSRVARASGCACLLYTSPSPRD